MEITTTGRRFKLTGEVKEFAEKRISKLSKYFDRITEAHLVLAEEKYRQIAELTLHANGTELISREESTDMMSSIDHVVDRMEAQVKKYAARLKDRKLRRPVPSHAVVEEAELAEVEVEEEFAPVVVRSPKYAPKPMLVEEAIRELRERDFDFLMFKNQKSGNWALVYIRSDGNFGLVEPE
ncbi:MAG: ribosome-associated translation inhibitor RaiA [Candidatus Eisenbacteria bacterium]|nr:ribosome-associated translation inhibitor RaiA [Candidatus Eisenbacteria bacterium]MCC7140673.1 ribosome-associated translation inhibitor RaiA [Candidatus Eisenbacteria bacterium]